jgi:hypothetical protein
MSNEGSKDPEKVVQEIRRKTRQGVRLAAAITLPTSRTEARLALRQHICNIVAEPSSYRT